MRSRAFFTVAVVVAAVFMQFFALGYAVGGDMSNVTPADVKKLIDSKKKFTLIDVRTPEEFAEGHIKGAVPLYTIDDITKYRYEGKVILYCRSGKRSAAAWKNFDEKGIKNIHNMTGGILEWQDSGYEVEKGPYKGATK